MKKLWAALAAFCLFGFLFSVSPWLGMCGVFLGIVLIPKCMPKIRETLGLPPKPATDQARFVPAPQTERSVGEEKTEIAGTEAERLTGAEEAHSVDKKSTWPAKVAGWIVFAMCFAGTKTLFTHLSTETRIAIEKRTGWNSDFKKSFITHCAVTAHAETMKELEAEYKVTPQLAEYANNYAQGFCVCFTDKIEASSTIEPIYNKMTDTRDSAGKRNEAAISKYIESPEGKLASSNCAKGSLEKAVAKLKAEASENDTRSPSGRP